MTPLPVLKTTTVFHIGTLDPNRKQRDSHEGHCLSVSRCPEAWRGIVRLGGFPLWRLSRPGATFVDVLRLAKDADLVRRITAWGLDRKLVELRQLWKAWGTDEAGDWHYSLHASDAAAFAEVDDDEGPNGSAVEPVEILTGTPLLAAHVRVANLDTTDAFDFLALVFTEQMLPDADGLWWSEIFDPEALSAPRGGILPDRLARFNVRPISFASVDDDVTSRRLHPARLPFQLST